MRKYVKTKTYFSLLSRLSRKQTAGKVDLPPTFDERIRYEQNDKTSLLTLLFILFKSDDNNITIKSSPSRELCENESSHQSIIIQFVRHESHSQENLNYM